MSRIPPKDPAEESRRQLRIPVAKVQGETSLAEQDQVAAEEPLEIRLRAGEQQQTVAVTMRTPGDDRELALGFLFAEGVIASAEEVSDFQIVEDPWGAPGQPSNVLEVELSSDELPELARLERHFFASSACGICGKAGIENLRLKGNASPPQGMRVERHVLYAIPQTLRKQQGVFSSTGGLHAAALFDAKGKMLAMREDIGRHNAVDKLVGWSLNEGQVPLHEGIILVSGRSSFEILQKAIAAGVPMVCSVSAPSSLAVELAAEFGVTLVGFLRGDRFNVYTAPQRVVAVGELGD